jgi:YVTN family beta-propeller protein
VPVRIAFQPDERYVWVGDDSDDKGGVVVIDPATLEVAARIPTGGGHHTIAFSADSRYAFVTSEKAGTLAVVDTQSLEKVKDVRTGLLPVAVDVSPLNQAIYVANGEDGAITVLDGSDFEPRATLQAAPGLYALRFTPDGRWGFVSNPGRNEVYLLDAADDRLAHTLTVDGNPDQISFSQTAAYIRSFDKPQAGIVQLADLGQAEPPPVTIMVYGQVAPRQSPYQSVADAIFPSVREQAMLIASPAEDLIYYYTEGAASSAGSFQGYGRVPRAVRVVDRGFRQEAPGIYSARFRVPESGDFVVAMLLDDPRVVHCFQFTAKPNSAAETEPASALPELTILTEAREFKAGEEFRLQFTLRDPTTQTPLADIKDVVVLVVQTGGNWNQRLAAEHLGDGVYEMRFTVPQPGLYTVFFSIPSANIGLDQLSRLTLQIVDN